MSNADKPAPIVAPTVNLNGTGRTDLIRQQREVYEACNTLLDLLRAAAPHGRDYQTAPDGAYQIARVQWEARISAVEKVQAESLKIFRVMF